MFVKAQLANETMRIRDAKIKDGEGKRHFLKKNYTDFFFVFLLLPKIY